MGAQLYITEHIPQNRWVGLHNDTSIYTSHNDISIKTSQKAEQDTMIY